MEGAFFDSLNGLKHKKTPVFSGGFFMKNFVLFRFFHCGAFRLMAKANH